jgi:hypothetical protein
MLDAQLTRFQRLFRGRESSYGQFRVDASGTKDPKTATGPIPLKAWTTHLEGKSPRGPFLGIVPVTDDDLVYFGALDYDDHGVDLEEMEARVNALKLPLVVCRSRSGGAHLYLFVRDAVPAPLMRERLTACKLALKLPNNPDGRAIEIFPKQDDTRKDGNRGSWINLPYYGGDKTTRYAIAQGERLNLADFLDHAEACTITSGELQALHPSTEGDAFTDGPPCLQKLHQIGVGKGVRAQVLINVGMYFKLKDPGRLEELLTAYNQDCITPPLQLREVSDTVRSLTRKSYVYMCNQLPLSEHCAKLECKKRRWGIGAFRRAENEAKFPTLDNLRKVTTDPPRWVLDVDGEEVSLTTDELLTAPKFRRAVFERLTRVVPTLKNHEWDERVEELVANVTVVYAPEDAGVYGQFRAHLAAFLEGRRSSDSRESLLLGKPWEEDHQGEPRVFFRSHDLYAFLERKRFKDYSLAQVWDALRGLGAGKHQFNIRKSCVVVWHLSTDEFLAGEQKEAFSVPIQPEPEF